jgi:hypothetical protein
MRLVHAIVLLAVTASPAFAQGVPEIVIPGKPGVPVYINGIDASSRANSGSIAPVR